MIKRKFSKFWANIFLALRRQFSFLELDSSCIDSSQAVNILGSAVTESLSQLLSSGAVVWKLPETVDKWMGMAVFQ